MKREIKKVYECDYPHAKPGAKVAILTCGHAVLTTAARDDQTFKDCRLCDKTRTGESATDLGLRRKLAESEDRMTKMQATLDALVAKLTDPKAGES